jgi:exoribonuclease-2
MNFLLVTILGEYLFANLLEEFKNNLLIEIYPDKVKKKIKSDQVILQLNTVNLENFIKDVNLLKQKIDINLFIQIIEECDKKISIFDLTKMYFSENYANEELVALLFALKDHNDLFSDDGYVSFSKDSVAIIQEKKEQKEQLMQSNLEYQKFYEALIRLEKPNFGDIDIVKVIGKADKNSNIYKALFNAAKFLQIDVIDLCYKVGIITNLADFFLKIFIRDTFPRGINYYVPDLLLNKDFIEDNSKQVKVFSIDDENTSEIDDAFSIKKLNDGYLVGVHISAPAIDKSLENIIKDNISTIYYPGGKITMLPLEIVKQYSLDEGKILPVVSIYFNIDNNFEIKEYYSKLEKVLIEKNLRVEELDLLLNDEDADFFYKMELNLLYNFALSLEQKRGKPSVNNISIDYNFKIDDNEHITIKPRQRGNKIDKTVSELMILANCSWGRLLTNNFIPAIYRVKQPNTPVKMTTQADSHTGLNVSYYTWATSPLRRASDYINQKQIIAMLLNSKDYYTATNTFLLQVVENFDITYNKYLTFQNKMERYWSLRYLLQEDITELDAIFVYKTKVQIIGVPIELDVQGLIKQKEKGSIIRIKIIDINLATLNFNFKILLDNKSE